MEIKDSYHLARIDEGISEANVLTTLDGRNGYRQVSISRKGLQKN